MRHRGQFPFGDLHWFFDHCETVSDRNLERIKALGGGIAIQDRIRRLANKPPTLLSPGRALASAIEVQSEEAREGQA
jgi:predicted amidohydrolase YtcJ